MVARSSLNWNHFRSRAKGGRHFPLDLISVHVTPNLPYKANGCKNFFTSHHDNQLLRVGVLLHYEIWTVHLSIGGSDRTALLIAPTILTNIERVS